MAKWVSVGTWCTAGWYLWLDRERFWCLLFAGSFSTLGGVGVSGGIICTLFSDCFGGCGVKLSRSGVAVMGGIFTLGNFGATLGGETGGCFVASVGTCCCGYTVAC